MQTILSHPLLILNELDDTCRRFINSTANTSNKATSDDQINGSIYSGISFTLGDNHLLIENIYIDEVIGSNFQQNLSVVPGAKPWLMGLISLRGQPLPVIDLKQYLLDEKSVQQKDSRLIVIKKDQHISGLFLENIEGLKQLPCNNINNNKKQNIDTHIFPEKITPFIDRTLTDENITLGSLSISRLINDKDFANAAR